VSVNIVTGHTEEVLVPDDEFHVARSAWQSLEEVSQNIGSASEYAFTNSAFIGLFETPSYLLAVMENGKFPTSDINPSFNYDYYVASSERRHVKVHVFDKHMEYIDSIRFDYENLKRYGRNLVTTKGDGVVFSSDTNLDAGAD